MLEPLVAISAIGFLLMPKARTPRHRTVAKKAAWWITGGFILLTGYLTYTDRSSTAAIGFLFIPFLAALAWVLTFWVVYLAAACTQKGTL